MKIIKTAMFVEAAALTVNNIPTDLINVVKALLPGQWQLAHTDTSFGAGSDWVRKQFQHGVAVHLYGTNVIQPKDRFYINILADVRKNGLGPPIEQKNSVGGGSLVDKQMREIDAQIWAIQAQQKKTRKDRLRIKELQAKRNQVQFDYIDRVNQSANSPADPVNSYNPDMGHALLTFTTFVHGWKPDMEEPPVKTPEQWAFYKKLIPSSVNPELRHGLQNIAQKVCQTPKEVAEFIHDVIYKFYRPDPGEDNDPEVAPQPTAPSNMVNV